LHHNNASSHISFFIREFSTKITWLSSFTHPNFLFPPFKRTLKRHIYDTTVVIEAESQAMSKTLSGHDFQDAFKMAEACIRIRAAEDYFESDSGQ
jgi:hypothetical protein